MPRSAFFPLLIYIFAYTGTRTRTRIKTDLGHSSLHGCGPAGRNFLRPYEKTGYTTGPPQPAPPARARYGTNVVHVEYYTRRGPPMCTCLPLSRHRFPPPCRGTAFFFFFVFQLPNPPARRIAVRFGGATTGRNGEKINSYHAAAHLPPPLFAQDLITHAQTYLLHIIYGLYICVTSFIPAPVSFQRAVASSTGRRAPRPQGTFRGIFTRRRCKTQSGNED